MGYKNPLALYSGNITELQSTDYLTDKDLDLIAYSLLGSAILAQTIGTRMGHITNNISLVSGTIRFMLVHLRSSKTITGVKWNQVTAGSYTGATYNGWGLHTISAGTLTRVALTTDDANIWKGSSGTIQSKAFSATYSASPGVYCLSCLYQQSAQTTAPVIGTSGNVNSGMSGLDFSNSVKISSTLASQTSIPASQAMSGLTVANALVWAGLY